MEAFVMLPGQEIKDLVENLKVAVDVLRTKRSEKDFVGNDEFLKMMGISKRTAQTWRDEGIIAFSQVGGKLYYKLADIDNLMEQNRHGQVHENKNRRN